MPDLDQCDLEAIRELKARYCRFVDTKQWAKLRSLFTDDCHFDGFGSAPAGSTADVFVEAVSARLADAVSVHHCHMPEIEARDDGTLRGIWAMTDFVEWPAGTDVAEAPGSCGFHGFGYYEEEYRRTGGGWKFSYLRLARTRIDALPEPRSLSRPGTVGPANDWLTGGIT